MTVLRAAQTLLAGSARTATTTTDDIVVSNKGALLFIDFTATPNNTETITLSVELKDPASGKYIAGTAFTALTSSDLGATPTDKTFLYSVYPGASETAATSNHEVQALALPHVWRVKLTHSASGSWTYTLGISGID